MYKLCVCGMVHGLLVASQHVLSCMKAKNGNPWKSNTFADGLANALRYVLSAVLSPTLSSTFDHTDVLPTLLPMLLPIQMLTLTHLIGRHGMVIEMGMLASEKLCSYS